MTLGAVANARRKQAAVPISFIGAAVGAANATSITIPTHNVGDLLVMIAWRTSSTTIPTTPAGWSNAFTDAAGGVPVVKVAYKIATATNDASGTWTNATFLLSIVYRNAAGIGGVASARAAATSYSFPAITMSNTDGSSWVVRASQGVYTTSPVPAGYTQRLANSSVVAYDTNGGMASAPSLAHTKSSSSANRAVTLELLAA